MEYGNLAYKLPERYEEPIRRIRPQKRETREFKTQTVNIKRNRVQMQYKTKVVRGMCVTVALAMSAGFMISKFVAVNEMKQEVQSLQKQLVAAESATSQMVFDLEQSIDLAQIEKEATTRLGMQRPEKYQTVYVNVKQDSVTERTAGEVEGIGHSIAGGLKKLGSNIVEFFSIK